MKIIDALAATGVSIPKQAPANPVRMIGRRIDLPFLGMDLSLFAATPVASALWVLQDFQEPPEGDDLPPAMNSRSQGLAQALAR